MLRLNWILSLAVVRELSNDKIVSKKLVHKWSLDQVFITDFEQTSTTEMILSAELPRSHGFYCEFPTQERVPDLALLIEVCRQACFVVAHKQLDVALDGNVLDPVPLAGYHRQKISRASKASSIATTPNLDSVGTSTGEIVSTTTQTVR